jgi:hypothetical protein
VASVGPSVSSSVGVLVLFRPFEVSAVGDDDDNPAPALGSSGWEVIAAATPSLPLLSKLAEAVDCARSSEGEGTDFVFDVGDRAWS